MNEPTETAQDVTGKVTAGQLCKMVKDGGLVGLSGEATYNRAPYSDSFVFNFRVTRAKIASEIRVPGWVNSGHTSKREDTEPFRPTGGVWYYSTEKVRDILQLLPSDAKVSFQVYLDAGTNRCLVRAGLHADRLYLHATKVVRGKRETWSFLVDATCGAHNSTRFGYGNRP